MRRYQRGFTIPEFVVVFGVLASLFVISYVRTISITQHTPLVGSVDTMLVDLTSQQTKAMIGDTQGTGSIDDYGILLQSNAYILFHGSSYSVTDSSNVAINLPTNITFTNVTFPNSTILFTKGSGELSGYSSGANSFTITQTLSGEQKTIQMNRYGVVTSVN